MNDFRFAEPAWIHGVWFILVLLITLVFFEVRRLTAVGRLLSQRMSKRLVAMPTLVRRIIGHVLLCFALLALVVAMMRPQWGGVVQQLTKSQSQIMVCLDVSKSMLAEDVVPSRLERAKAEIESLLGLLDDSQQVGLIAFAGKATILSPMTTDFGFLKLILKETGPHSVGLGGTKIGDAIRAGTDSFRSAGDVNRLLLVITDGEDHDSFPIDAAAYAGEKGVRIVSIGFGDEAGSRIEITDSATGKSSYLEDRDGDPVVSRLDGETLRDIALQTKGAYVPAGVGQLDLRSIYDAHISTMLKGTQSETQRVVRNEAYQWFVLLGFLLWGASLLLKLGRRVPPALLASLFVIAAFPLSPSHALADETGKDSDSKSEASTGPQPAVEAGSSAGSGSDSDGLDSGREVAETVLLPREIYNLAIGSLAGSLEQAEEQLTDARNRAGVDGELRFRAAYNLGWLTTERASALEEDEPEEALKQLQLAVGRFREAVRLRPDSEPARYNLEVVAKRILTLQDRLQKRDAGTLAQRLDKLIEVLRERESELKAVLAIHRPTQTPSKEERAKFRRLGVTQRQLISDFQQFSQHARAELETARSEAQAASSQTQQNAAGPAAANADGQQDPALRAAQIEATLAHVDLAMNWLQKSRSFTRRILPNSAFLRWTAAIRETRQARDQLRDPVEVISVLLSDSLELSQLTDRKSVELAESPNWLTADYLHDEQAADAQRTQQLARLLASAIDQADKLSLKEDAESAQLTDELREQIEASVPLLGRAGQHMDAAAKSFETENYLSGSDSQAQAIDALRLAAEAFFDMRRLIEAAYAEQLSIQSGFDTPTRELVLQQELNLTRAARLNNMFTSELENLASSQTASDGTEQAGPSSEPASAEQLAADKQRFELGIKILEAVSLAMQDISSELPGNVEKTRASDQENGDSKDELQSSETVISEVGEKLEAAGSGDDAEIVDDKELEEPSESVDIEEAGQAGATPAAESVDQFRSVDLAVENLEELRRLFFTLVEHLKDTASRQAELNQDTETALSADDTQAAGSLAERQEMLQAIADQIADALTEQADATKKSQAQSEQAPQPSPGAEASGDPSVKFSEAAKLVAQASAEQTIASNQIAGSFGRSDVQTENGAVETGQADTEKSLAGPPDSDPSDLAETEAAGSSDPRIAQLEALKRLIEAIQILDEQQEQDQDQEQDDGEDQDQQNQPQENESQQQEQQSQGAEPESEPQRTASAEQLLQIIRDREAQRRRDMQKIPASSSTTEKDW